MIIFRKFLLKSDLKKQFGNVLILTEKYLGNLENEKA